MDAIEKHLNALQPQRCYVEVQREAVHVPTKYLFDRCKGGIALQEFFGGIHFATGCVVLAVGSKDMIILMEEIALRRDTLC